MTSSALCAVWDVHWLSGLRMLGSCPWRVSSEREPMPLEVEAVAGAHTVASTDVQCGHVVRDSSRTLWQ